LYQIKENEQRQMSDAGQYSFLFVTREKYPSYRVDLTELFSMGITGRGGRVDWIMQSSQPSFPKILKSGKRERVFMGPAVSNKGLLAKTINVCLGLINDLRIWTISRSNSYNFIQVRDKFFASIVGLITARMSRILFFYWMSFPFPEADVNRALDSKQNLSFSFKCYYFLRGYLTKFLLHKLILPRADHIFVQSNEMKRSLVNKSISPVKITPVPMGISVAQFDEREIKPSKDRRLQGRIPVVYIGTLSRSRGLDFLIKAFHIVHKRIPRAVLVLVGSASERDMDSLRNEVRSNALQEHVLFTGFLPLQEAWSYVRAATVCVSPIPPNPILNAGSPTKIIEYMAWRKPVVANYHPVQSRLIKESGGGLAVPYEINAFAKAICALLEDTEKAYRMGACGKLYVHEHRSYDRISNMLEEKYRKLLKYNQKGLRH
jgi:glycosyltransferase involved in cell wall biosynthesis